MYSLVLAALAADILLTGGRVLDGAGNPWVRADIAIREDRIVFVGDARRGGGKAPETGDRGGLLRTPGTRPATPTCRRPKASGPFPFSTRVSRPSSSESTVRGRTRSTRFSP